MRIGIFGGTFDPPHTGHLIAAQDSAIALDLDRVDFVPARIPPHKQSRIVTPAPIRLAMLEAAIADESRFRVNDIELDRPGPSYTVATLRAYRSADAAAELFLLIGMDQYAEFHTWREPSEIRRLATIAVLARDGEVPGDGPCTIAVTRVDISSTRIRERVAAGRPIRYLVPAAVETLIRAHGLYAAPGSETDSRPNRPGSVG